jgi:hypothetical protein
MTTKQAHGTRHAARAAHSNSFIQTTKLKAQSKSPEREY